MTSGFDWRLQIPRWRIATTVGQSFRLDSDAAIRPAIERTFLRRYDISRDDRLRSMFELERIDENSYFALAGYATQKLHTGAPQGQVPITLPVLDCRRRLDAFGDKLELHRGRPHCKVFPLGRSREIVGSRPANRQRASKFDLPLSCSRTGRLRHRSPARG